MVGGFQIHVFRKPSDRLGIRPVILHPKIHQHMYVLHPWHGAPTGDKYPEKVNALIEISREAVANTEIDKHTGLLKLDRVIYSSFHYPVNYGFIPAPWALMATRWTFWSYAANPFNRSASWKLP